MKFLVKLTVFLIMGWGYAYSQQDYFVSVVGDDQNPGTESKPFKTLERVRDILRKATPKSANYKSSVVIKQGIYPLETTFELDQRDSFTSYRAMAGEKVQIIGGIEIPISAVTNVSDNTILSRIIEKIAQNKILQIDLKALGLTNYGELGPRGFRRAYIPSPMELVIDGKVMQIARWPNKGETSVPMGNVVNSGSKPRKGDFGMIPGTFKYANDRPLKWTQANDLYVSGIFGEEWADDTIKVAKLDTENGTFTTTLPHLYSFKNGVHRCWYGINLLEEIDVPGEYYLDKSKGMLYFFPPENFSRASTIFVSKLDKTMVAIENAENVTFENLIFEISRDSGIYIEGGKDHTIVGCTFRNLGSLAIQMGQGAKPFPEGLHDGCGNMSDGKIGVPVSRMMGSWNDHIYKDTAWNRNAGVNHNILSCDIYDTGAGGIMLGGGDRKTLTSGNSLVKNCNIYRVNRLDQTYKAPINVDGVGHQIINNHLHHGSGAGIYLHGNDHVIQYNEINNLCEDCSDMGAIYMGRDPSETGNAINYNFIHHIKNTNGGGSVMGVYFDDTSIYGANVVGNIFYEVGLRHVILINGGNADEIRNNMVINSANNFVTRPKTDIERCVKFMEEELGRVRLTKNVDVTQPPYSEKYPKLFKAYKSHAFEDTPLIANVIIRQKFNDEDGSKATDLRSVLFQLAVSEEYHKEIQGFEPIPFEKIGLYKDSWRK